jgi:hypothetical protein
VFSSALDADQIERGCHEPIFLREAESQSNVFAVRRLVLLSTFAKDGKDLSAPVWIPNRAGSSESDRYGGEKATTSCRTPRLEVAAASN